VFSWLTQATSGHVASAVTEFEQEFFLIQLIRTGLNFNPKPKCYILSKNNG